MLIFLITLGFFIVIALAMAVGYIFQQKTLAGSCGGLSSVGIEKSCNCDTPCEKRQERERIALLKETANDKLKTDNTMKIDIKNI